MDDGRDFVFFDPSGQPEHLLSEIGPDSLTRTAYCGWHLPVWFMVHPRHKCRLQNLSFTCATCEAERRRRLGLSARVGPEADDVPF